MGEVRVARRKLLRWVLVASAAILLCCLPLIWEIARYFIGEMAVDIDTPNQAWRRSIGGPVPTGCRASG